MAVATVSALAIAGIVINQYANTSMDKIIPSGDVIQRMSRWMEEPVTDKMYASHIKSDNKQYRTWFAAEKGATYVKNMVSDKPIKIAGRKTALKTFDELVKSDTELNAKFGGNTKKAYDIFNKSTMYSPDVNDKKIADTFYNKLVEKGYSAVRDVNDQKNSGIKSPIILFNVKDSITVKETSQVTEDTIPKKYKEMYNTSTKNAQPYRPNDWWQ